MTFLYYPDNKIYTVKQLERWLNFIYLSHNSFETPQDRNEIKEKGINQEITAQALELGIRFAQEIKTAYLPKVSIRWINKQLGHGLFLEENLEEGVNERRFGQPLNNYLYEYPINDEIGRSYVIDATQGNATRFINHSFTPNLQPIHVFCEDFYHLIFITLCAIKRGEQLSYNYGSSYWAIRESPSHLASIAFV